MEKGTTMSKTASATRSKMKTVRVCDEKGCVRLLSQYNEFDFCAQHQPMVFPRMRGVILD